MSVDCFLDTNVLVYAVSSAPTEQWKKRTALRLIEQVDWGLSVQVLQELYVTVTRKLAAPLPPDRALALIDELRRFPLVTTDYPLVVAGIERSVRYGISYWDGAVLAASERLGADVLFTEDLSDGQRYGPVRVVNPFRGERSAVHERHPPYG